MDTCTGPLRYKIDQSFVISQQNHVINYLMHFSFFPHDICVTIWRIYFLSPLMISPCVIRHSNKLPLQRLVIVLEIEPRLKNGWWLCSCNQPPGSQGISQWWRKPFCWKVFSDRRLKKHSWPICVYSMARVSIFYFLLHFNRISRSTNVHYRLYSSWIGHRLIAKLEVIPC